MIKIQREYVEAGGCWLSLDNWAKALAVKLLEATHGQWLNRNIVIHDLVGGLEAGLGTHVVLILKYRDFRKYLSICTVLTT